MAPPPSTPDKRPDLNAYDETVEIKVGADEKSFTIHKNVICFYSGYFERVFNGGFAEAQAKSVTLPEEDVDNFRRCIDTIYQRGIPEVCRKNFHILSEMWAFADRREIPILMNACITAVRDVVVHTWSVPGNTLPYIYRNTTETSGLRRFAIDIVAKTGNGKLLPKDGWTLEIYQDILAKVWPVDFSKNYTKDQVAQIDMCQYHHHEEGVKCPKKT